MPEEIDASAAELTKEYNLKPECAEKLADGRELDEDNPCWEGYEMVGTKIDENGNEVPNCVPEEDAAALASSTHILGGTLQLADEITREELSGNTVRYTGIKALTDGVWTDQNSGEPIHYMPENLSVDLGSDVNVMHDGSDVSEAGKIVDSELGTDSNGKDALYLDFELDTSTEAGAYADKALKEALESDGEGGFGGPSVEIPAEGQEIKSDGPKGHPYIADGKVAGLGLVGQPAARDTAFKYQTQERAVALADGESALLLNKEDTTAMSTRKLAKSMEEAKEMMRDMGYDDPDRTMEDMDEEEMEELAYEMAELMDHMGGHNEDEDEGMEMMDEEEMMDMIESLRERIENVEEEHEELINSAAAESELSATKSELADLRAKNKELSERLETLEDQPNNEKRTMAEGRNTEDWTDADAGVSYDANSL